MDWKSLKLLQQRLAVENSAVAPKAAELLRLAAVKVPIGTLRQVQRRRSASLMLVTDDAHQDAV